MIQLFSSWVCDHCSAPMEQRREEKTIPQESIGTNPHYICNDTFCMKNITFSYLRINNFFTVEIFHSIFPYQHPLILNISQIKQIHTFVQLNASNAGQEIDINGLVLTYASDVNIHGGSKLLAIKRFTQGGFVREFLKEGEYNQLIAWLAQYVTRFSP